MQDSIEDYIRISRNIKEGPTQVSVSRKEALITAQIKKECDAKAMQILQFAIEGKMRSDALFRCLPYINQSHYQDIVEERAISKLCGYPLCSRHIPDMPKKQFYISTKVKRLMILRIERRKIFLTSLNKTVQLLFQSLKLNPNLVLSDLQALVKTFKLKPDNIVFKPPLWNYIAIILLKILSIKDESLKKCLDTENSKDHFNVWLSSLPHKDRLVNDVLKLLKDIDTFVEDYIISRDHKIVDSDINVTRKKVQRELKDLAKKVFTDRYALDNVDRGDKQKLRNTISDHRELQLAFQNSQPKHKWSLGIPVWSCSPPTTVILSITKPTRTHISITNVPCGTRPLRSPDSQVDLHYWSKSRALQTGGRP
ncbi:hypothetical protein Zmor_007178 [Zophobas morio]|uniref:RNA polymerase II subunit B1 CTD phosphatase RPAP2 homolog n=1 Tax=Zophobas morio TaxID=2755281 RepID=A0AA38MND0_9CUCU|nr:hypothetical protein Zmor_007178 [Zophobas morio]